ncbi:Glutamate synthase [NADPH] large chain [hydrothermal vent metagenome]|uniref:Glutamate synthase [NADPH] large chain n=1 Tax=hydrothermal vent metagenome TaxID=652676 RepID=A0A3B1C418_9ZZZZ
MIKENLNEETLALDSKVPLEKVSDLARGYKKVSIDCGVMEMSGVTLNSMMKAARSAGVTDFKLLNVCGQTLVGTGMDGPANVEVHGLIGNHSAAFIDQIKLDTFPTYFPNEVWCPGDAQVAIGNTSNPTEMNIGGSVDDLFASYCPSGTFRVAGQGGNRCGLRAGAGIPHAWREINHSQFEEMDKHEIKETLLRKYQLRKARINNIGWDDYLKEFRLKVEDRNPPVIMFGRKVRDYFMEYAQGTIGIVLNVYDVETPVGYYVCSGMTAGKAFIRGEIPKERLGIRVGFAELTDGDRDFISEQIIGFYKTFDGRLADTYQARLDQLMKRFYNNRDELLDTFNKIVSAF